eukprot:TRINITY_DN14219_c0_g1_i3.p1 TRINITY_DN14219_c0_g1~~TRINITY_DN14219_c0_g1_i3.p1  ORF type:complete len:804 (+),score=256.05 TRINITY_DN14219_c0_g1_i3:133-2544(+)
MSEMNLTGLLYSLPNSEPYEQQYVPVPLISVKILAKVVNFITEVEVTQEYQNKEKNPIEVIYFFPVEEEAAVTACSAELEGRTVEAKVQEKEKAQKLYDEAIKEKKTAFLLQETKADIFQLNVGNLSPGAGCKVKITYLMELPVEDGKTRLTIPTTIAPKYVPAKDGSEVAKKISSIEYDLTSPAELHLQLDISMKSKISSVTSPSHQMTTEMKKKLNLYEAVTKFDGMTTDMDRDIIVLIDSNEPNQPKIFLEKGDDGSIAGLVSMVPKFELKKQPSDVIFLIDCSGSMGGQSMQLAKQALQLFVHSLPVDSYFNIFCFGSSFTQLFPQSRAFTDESLESAKQLLQGLDANLGGTEIFHPLKAIFSSPNLVGKPRQVFVITDGQVSNSEQCIQLVEEFSQHNRVFTLGIGASADRHLVKGMARVGRGVPSFTTYGENIAGKVLKQLKQALQPCVHDVQVNWSPGQGADTESSQAPLRAPPVYDGSRMLLYKLWSKAGGVGEKVTITAKTPEGNLSLDILLGKDSFIEGEMIHKMFARKMIQELEENFEKKDPAEVKSIITELGLKYSLGTKYTAFIGVDSLTNKESGLKTRQVRNQVAYGYGMDNCMVDSMGSVSRSQKCGAAPMRMMMMRSAPKMMRSAPGAAPPGAAPPGAPAPSFGSMPSSFDSMKECAVIDGYDDSYSDDSDDDVTKECGVMSRSTKSARVPQTNIDKIVALTSLQTAAGYFKEDSIAESIIGEKFAAFKKQCVEKKIETTVWLTALIIAYLEKNFPDEKDTWELIVDKAKDWLGKNDVIRMATNILS